MCGIAGVIHKEGLSYYANIEQMNLAQKHRGPDDSGIVKLNSAIFGHTRLSIVDINSGHQPMSCNNKNITISFNGEIYGYKNLRKNLDYDFTTHSDTEVIVALYKQYSLTMFSKLKGMFAFGIWDAEKRSLLLARDRFGEKPLYYAFGNNGEFVFASEIKAIIASNLVKPKVSKKALGHYLQYLYIDPLETIYENIHTLEPGCFLEFVNDKVNINRYYHYPKTQDILIDDATNIFKEKFEKSVENQLIADVDVGAFLSGGLDSSTIVAVAKKYKTNLKTFSFGFEGSKSELSYAREIASKYNTNHYELFAEDVDISQILLKMADVYDEPFADSSNIPTYLISKLAREHSKVVLTGDGADELLGGYGWWYDPLLGIGEPSNYFKEMTLRVLAKSLFKSDQSRANRMKYGRRYTTVKDAHLDRSTNFNNNEVNDLLNMNYSKIRFYAFEEENTINDALNIDLQEYMTGDILVKTDRASMANSLELRSPFLDVDFASFCISLPASLKITNKADKLILRKAYQDTWTKSIRSRSKQGFGAPIGQWLKQKNMVALKDEYFKRHRAIFSYVSFDVAKKYFFKDNYQTWILLVLSIWFEKNVEYIE